MRNPTMLATLTLPIAMVLLGASGGCGAGTPGAEPAVFDASRAWKDLEAIVAL
jgi:hypothetical protein